MARGRGIESRRRLPRMAFAGWRVGRRCQRVRLQRLREVVRVAPEEARGEVDPLQQPLEPLLVRLRAPSVDRVCQPDELGVPHAPHDVTAHQTQRPPRGDEQEVMAGEQPHGADHGDPLRDERDEPRAVALQQPFERIVVVRERVLDRVQPSRCGLHPAYTNHPPPHTPIRRSSAAPRQVEPASRLVQAHFRQAGSRRRLGRRVATPFTRMRAGKLPHVGGEPSRQEK